MMKSSRENAEVQTNTRGVDTKGLINREKRWEKECKNIKRNYKIKLKCKLVPLLQTISLHIAHMQQWNNYKAQILYMRFKSEGHLRY